LLIENELDTGIALHHDDVRGALAKRTTASIRRLTEMAGGARPARTSKRLLVLA
jgi:hypothetical protein